MSNRSAWAFLIGSTLLAVVLAAGLIASNFRQAPDLKGQSTTEARARAIEPEVAEQVRSALGADWNVAARLVALERYRGRFGLPAWEADYELTVTSPEAPAFRQTMRTTRSIGPGAVSLDSAQVPGGMVYETLGALTSPQRRSLLEGVAAELDNAPLLLVERLGAAGGSRPWAENGEPSPRLIAIGAGGGVEPEDLYVVEASGTPEVSLWGWNGTRFVPLARIQPKTAEALPW